MIFISKGKVALAYTYAAAAAAKSLQSCPTLVTQWAIQSMEFSMPEYWSG